MPEFLPPGESLRPDTRNTLAKPALRKRHIALQEPLMTSSARADIEMGQLALALVMEDFRRRLERKDVTEMELADLVTAALKRFPPDFEAELREYIAVHSPAT